MQRPAWAEINLGNLAFNFHSSKKFIGENVKYMAVVKADAYGHGAVECARRLEKEGVDWFAVAIPEEGIELRKSGITKPILVLGSFWQGQEKLLLEYDLTPTIFQIEKAEILDAFSKSQNRKTNIHVKIDTGMNRVGVRFDEFKKFAEKLKTFENLNVEGVMTHFAAADNLQENDFTNLQIERFYHCVEILNQKGFQPIYQDLANSPGAVAHENARGNLVRLGGILYGLGGDILPKEIEVPPLKPVMAVKSEITLLKTVPKGESIGYSRTFQAAKNSVIASIPFGYHDGYPRPLSNNSRVIIKGKYAPLVGRISMDWILADVSEIENAAIGDEVIVIGRENDLQITAEELSAKLHTISYEITCGINKRVRKTFKD